MKIYIPLNAFTNQLFNIKDLDNEALIEKISDYYQIDNAKINISEDGDFIEVEIDLGKTLESNTDYNKLINLCEKRNFIEALPLALKISKENPGESETYRLLGQINSELGNHDEAINHLIDALKWNPENEWALLMMGNIYAKFKSDLDTALIYYNEILKNSPDNFITLTNIGAVLYQSNDLEKAKDFLNKSLSANSNYPNTYLALGLISEKEKNYYEAFEFGYKAIVNKTSTDEVYNNSLRLCIDSAKEYENDYTNDILNKFVKELEYRSEKKIKIVSDESIQTPAKIEFAENYNRDYHIVKYKSTYDAVNHLILHELIHLELVLDARKSEENKLFTTNDSSLAKFKYSQEKFKNTLIKKGISEDSINKFLKSLFDGINSQAYNTPIDLFIEDIIFNKFKEFRPLQFLSLLRFIKEGTQATTRKDIIDNVPKNSLSVSKIYNLVNAKHFKNLYKIDLIRDFKATKSELLQAEKFYNEFLEYRLNKNDGEEYELIQHWGEDLKIDSYFNLIPELEHKKTNIDNVINDINNDPYGINSEDSSNDRKMKKFLNEHSNDDINNAVVMYMIDALNYFKDFSNEEIKKIAFELATIGMTGINPNDKNYSIPSIKNSSFSGYKTLAYYYTSWALAIPEMLNSLQLPFSKEYELANQMNKL